MVPVLCKPDEHSRRELDAKGLQLQCPVLHYHVERFRVHDVVVAPDEVIGLIQLLVGKAVIALQAKMETDHVICAAGGTADIFFELHDAMAHADIVELPDGVVHRPFFELYVLPIFHVRVKVLICRL